MNPIVILRRFFTPGILVTLQCWLKFRAFVSHRAEVEVTSNLRLGAKVNVGSFSKLKAADGPLEIGDYTNIGTGCFITGSEGGLKIGERCLIGPNVTIISNSYKYARLDVPMQIQGTQSKGTTIGNNVSIGASTAVVDGASIGDNVIISPCSYVSGKIPENSIVQGNPAKVIFTRR